MSNNPIKQHYVHESYQKRFLSQEKKLYTLIKEFKFKISLKSPGQICYELNLNTLKQGDQNFYEIEQFYSQIEGECAKYFEIMDGYNAEFNGFFGESLKSKESQLIFKLFIALMFWRNPNQYFLAKQYFNKILVLYDNSNKEVKKLLGFNRQLIKVLQKRSDKKDVQKIIQFILLPIITFKIFEESIGISSYKVENEEGTFITSDNPVVPLGSPEELFSYESFIFPVDNQRVISSLNYQDKMHSLNEINLLIAHKANKYIMSGSEKNLICIRDILQNTELQ